jgi:hypothetical protein
MMGSDEDRGSSRRLGVEEQEWSSTGRVFGGRTIERTGDVCVVYTMHKETRSTSFLV